MQVFSSDFQSVVTLLKPNKNDFISLSNISKKDNEFTVSILLEPGTYQLKVTSKNIGIGSYEIKAWVTDVEN
ncbi:MAG TPA: hypothetical protein VK184_06720 [Nostocaceae cyanobacterium]|nr:hypothetical protein [Nostocaceae cyanobacterium]